MAKHSNRTYMAISILGKSLKLSVNFYNIKKIELIQNKNSIDLFLPKSYKNSDNIDIINMSIKKLYEKIADTEIEYSMEIARHILRFAPEDYEIKRLKNCFYRCSKNIITINPDIVQFNREIINTSIIQAFCKLKYKTNTNAYKTALAQALELYENYKFDLSLSYVS